MITPAVLISACGTLIFSTANRLARVVDRVRALTRLLEQLYASDQGDFVSERREESERQLSLQARRSRIIQRSLTALYVALGFFVGTTISIGIAGLAPHVVLAAHGARRHRDDRAVLRLHAAHQRDAPGAALGRPGDGVRAEAARDVPGAARPAGRTAPQH
jgi:hypothetical protein